MIWVYLTWALPVVFTKVFLGIKKTGSVDYAMQCDTRYWILKQAQENKH